MTRKKKNSNDFNKGKKSKSLPPHLLERRIIDLFSKQVTSQFNSKSIVLKLQLANSKESVQQCLNQLVTKGILEPASTGNFRWNKNAVVPVHKERSREGKISVGIIDITRNGSAYVVTEDLKNADKDIFVPAHKIMGALNGDTVEVSWYMSNRGKPEGYVTKIVQRKNDHFIGKLVISRNFAFVAPDGFNVPMDIEVDVQKLPAGAKDGDKVIVAITKWPKDGKDAPFGEITMNFGKEEGNDIEMITILVQKGFSLTFPPDVLKENELINTEITPEEIALRRDMRNDTTFTIDPETAKDFDDALSLKLLENGNYEVGVHIADVTHYVKPDTALDKEAAKRTTSVYLVDRVLPMLPENLSNGVCSLRPNEEKLTFSVVFEMTKEGKIINEWFGKTVIYSDRRFSYEEAQERLDSKTGDFAEELGILNSLAHKLRNQRFKNGGSINFESPEVRFKLDETGKPLEVYLKTRQDAHMLIEDFMLLANKQVGRLIYDLHEKLGFQWPMVYRVHDLPDMEKVRTFAEFAGLMGYPMKVENPDQVKPAFSNMLQKAEGKSEFNVLQQLGIRTMAKAAYSSNNIGHYGLGFATYSHFTSPIRRYADVLAHRVLFDYLSNNNKRLNPVKLEELCKYISKKERDAMEAERESVKYKQAEFLEAHVGDVFQGNISGIADHGIYVTLQANFCEGMVRYDRMYDFFEADANKFHIKSETVSYKIGDVVSVRILSSNKLKRQIDFELLDPNHLDDLPPLDTKKEAPKREKESKKVAEESKKSSKVKVTQEPKHKSSTKPLQTVEIVNAKGYESLIRQTSTAFDSSDIKAYANKKQLKWLYELTPSAPVQGSILLLEYNPTAAKTKGYRGQKVLSQIPFEPEGSHKNFFPKYFPYKVITQGYFCPFRSLEERQLSKKDLDLTFPIFKEFLKLLQPSQIICFSVALQNKLLAYNILSDIVEEEIVHEERTIAASKAMIEINGVKTPIYFLPKPSAHITKELKEKAWDWALSI